jgi:hypothetical protein
LGTLLDVDGWSHFAAGEPIQPRFFADLSNRALGAQVTGTLRGAVFVGGIYSDVQAFDPVIASPYNEYVTSTDEPVFGVSGWYPRVPFQVNTDHSISTTAQTLVMLLGQYNSDDETERLYTQMSFDTYYSGSADTLAPTIAHVDDVLATTLTRGSIKVEAADDSGIARVIAAYTDGQGTWRSQDLTYDAAASKWVGAISGTLQTRYFVQVVDGAGNVTVDDNKGLNRSLASPLQLVPSRARALYLPLIMKGG